ncbi:MAG TPA: response regulator [Alphaproteobacteria bacterium]
MTGSLQYLRVLIVEDQKNAQNMLYEMVRSLGIQTILLASNGKEALGVLNVEAPDTVNLIICDWMMPEMTGLELLTEIRKRYPTMPFLMVTGRNELDAVKTAMKHGVSAYIAKPFGRSQIEIKLRVLGRKLLSDRSLANMPI